MFKEQIPANQSENDDSNPEENLSERSGLLGKFKGKTKGIAKVLTIATALNVAPALVEKTKTLIITEANAAEIPHRPTEINSGNIKKLAENFFQCDFSFEQAEKIATAYQGANAEQMQQTFQISNKAISFNSAHDAEKITNFLINRDNIKMAKSILNIPQNSAANFKEEKKFHDEKNEPETKQDIGEIISSQDINFPNGKLTIIKGKEGEHLRLDARGARVDARSLLDKSVVGNNIEIKLTEEGKRAYKGRFVTEAQEKMMIKHAVMTIAQERYLYFQALEQAKKLGNQKAIELIQHELDEQKLQVEKLYGNIFIK